MQGNQAVEMPMLRAIPLVVLSLLLGCAGSGPAQRRSVEVRRVSTPEVYELFSQAHAEDSQVQIAFLDFPGMPAQIPFLGDLPILSGLFNPAPVTPLADQTWSELLRAAFPPETFAAPYALIEQGTSLVAVQRPEVLDKLQAALDQICREQAIYEVLLKLYHLPGCDPESGPSAAQLEGVQPIHAPRLHVYAGQAASIASRNEQSYIADYMPVRVNGKTVLDPAIDIAWSGFQAEILVDLTGGSKSLELDFELRELHELREITAPGIGTIQVPESTSLRVERTLAIGDDQAWLSLGAERWLSVEVRRIRGSD